LIGTPDLASRDTTHVRFWKYQKKRREPSRRIIKLDKIQEAQNLKNPNFWPVGKKQRHHCGGLAYEKWPRFNEKELPF